MTTTRTRAPARRALPLALVGLMASLALAPAGDAIYRIGNDYFAPFPGFDETIGLEDGGHFSFYARFPLDLDTLGTQELVRLEDASGATIATLDATVQGFDNYGGATGDVTVQPGGHVLSPTMDWRWHRFDITYADGVLRLEMDQKDHVNLTTAQGPARAVAPAGDRLEHTFLRWTSDDVLVAETFSTDPSTRGWERVEEGRAYARVYTWASGAPYMYNSCCAGPGGPGVAWTRNLDGDRSLAFHALPVAIEGQMLLETTFRPDNDLSLFHHHAVLAGITNATGPGEVVWALTASGAGSELTFSLIDSAGVVHPLHLQVDVLTFPWSYSQNTVTHLVRVWLDADAGTFRATISGGSGTAPGADLSRLGEVERLAVGDVFVDHMPTWTALTDPTQVHGEPSGLGDAEFDDVVVQRGWDLGFRDA